MRMSGEISLNGSPKYMKTTCHRKKKRRKCNKSLASDIEDSRSAAGFIEIESSNSWGTGPFWYWSNYQKALGWRSKHQIALWKSLALGLQQENRFLMMELQKQVPDQAFNAPLTLSTLEQPVEKSYGIVNKMRSIKSDEDEEGSSLSNEEIEFEMSEEMMKFFEQSIRHKLEIKRLKGEECDSINTEAEQLQEADVEREKEMKLLYGDGSSMIIGMETAIQLSFDKYCDLKSPKYWPNIPLKL